MAPWVPQLAYSTAPWNVSRGRGRPRRQRGYYVCDTCGDWIFSDRIGKQGRTNCICGCPFPLAAYPAGHARNQKPQDGPPPLPPLVRDILQRHAQQEGAAHADDLRKWLGALPAPSADKPPAQTEAEQRKRTQQKLDIAGAALRRAETAKLQHQEQLRKMREKLAEIEKQTPQLEETYVKALREHELATIEHRKARMDEAIDDAESSVADDDELPTDVQELQRLLLATRRQARALRRDDKRRRTDHGPRAVAVVPAATDADVLRVEAARLQAEAAAISERAEQQAAAAEAAAAAQHDENRMQG